MKKTLMVISAGLLLMFATTTQSVAQLKLGVIGGANFNDITGSDIDSEGMGVGYHIGGFLNIGNKLMVEPQVLYSVKGSKVKDGNLNLSYIEIPIWVRYQLEGGLNFNAGPYMAILVGAKDDGDDAKDNYKSSDWGLGFGIGYQLQGGLGFAVNYNQGLANVGEDVEVFGQKVEFDAHTTNIKLSLSYTFGGRRE